MDGLLWNVKLLWIVHYITCCYVQKGRNEVYVGGADLIFSCIILLNIKNGQKN